MLFHSSVPIAVLHRDCCPEEMGGTCRLTPAPNHISLSIALPLPLRSARSQPSQGCYATCGHSFSIGSYFPAWDFASCPILLQERQQWQCRSTGCTTSGGRRRRAIRLMMLPYGLLAIEPEDDDACAMGASPRGGTSTVLAFSRLLVPRIGAVVRSGSPSSGGGRFRPSLSFRLGLAGMFGQP